MLKLLWLVLVLMFPDLAKIAWKPPIHNSISFSQQRNIETGNEIQSDKRFPQTASSFHVLCLFTVTHNLIIPFAFCSWNFSCLLKPFNNTSFFFPPLCAWKKSAKEFIHILFLHTQSYVKRCLSGTRKEIWLDKNQRDSWLICIFSY